MDDENEFTESLPGWGIEGGSLTDAKPIGMEEFWCIFHHISQKVRQYLGLGWVG